MSDRRLTPANDRVAAAYLQGQVTAESFTEGRKLRLAVPVADLLNAPEGRRERQLVLGARVTEYESRRGWSFVQAEADGYVGYLRSDGLGPDLAATHRVVTRATHAYRRADLKSGDRLWLSMGAELQVTGQEGRFAATPQGFVPMGHLAPLDALAADPVTVADRLLGTPYLWGGNSAMGIDCSGLVQVAYRLCGLPCPGDSDMQARELGETLPEGTPPERGDLLFWKGHVALVSDPRTILHANAGDMAVAYEDLATALARIAGQGEGAPTRHARPR